MKLFFVVILLFCSFYVHASTKEVYEKPKKENSQCSFFYWHPSKTEKGYRINYNELSEFMASKAKLKPADWRKIEEQGRKWVEVIFDNSSYQRKKIKAPPFIFGTLLDHALSPDKLEKHFGKAHRKNMTLSMMGNRITVRFEGKKKKPVCGKVNIHFYRWEVKEGVLVLHDANFTPKKFKN